MDSGVKQKVMQILILLLIGKQNLHMTIFWAVVKDNYNYLKYIYFYKSCYMVTKHINWRDKF